MKNDAQAAKKRFGEMAVHKGYCTPADVKRALNIQRQLGRTGHSPRPLGLVMLSEGIIDNEQFIDLLKDLENYVHHPKP